MAGLNRIERECQEVLVLIAEMMTPGKGKITNWDHMQLAGKVRDVVRMLHNKQYGCSTGKHSGPCACIGGLDGGLTPRPSR